MASLEVLGVIGPTTLPHLCAKQTMVTMPVANGKALQDTIQ